MKKKLFLGLALCIFLASFAIAGSAGATPLADLIKPGKTISSGDKTFSDFGYSTTSAPPARPIQVLPVFWTTTEPGLGFTGWLAGRDVDLNSTISFSVKPTSPNMGIDDVILQAAAVVAPGGSVSVTETVYTGMSDPPLATLTFSSTTSTTFDETSTFSAVYPSLYVVDTVSVEGGTCSFPLSSVGFDNRFSQAPVPVPPALLLFAPGLLGLIGMRKRLPK